MEGLKKAALRAAGMTALGLGVAGVFLPLLPTTPLLLLAMSCFMGSSPRLHRRVLESRWLGPYVRDYVEHRGVRRGARRRTLMLLWLTLGVSAVLVARPLVALGLAVVGAGVSAHILSLRVLEADRPDDAEPEPDPGPDDAEPSR